MLAGPAGVAAAPALLLGAAVVTMLVAGLLFAAEPRSWTPRLGPGRYLRRHAHRRLEP